MLVRTKRANAGIEVFMVRRSARSPFAPDAVVFPGGALDPEDADLAAVAVREFEEETGVRLDRSALVPFSHWITPPNEGRRYDTHFFLAVAPEDQTPVADEHETHDGRWLDPSEALQAEREGDLRLVYPTIKHLERLAAFESVDALMTFARTKPIRTVAPPISPDLGYVMPADLEGVW